MIGDVYRGNKSDPKNDGPSVKSWLELNFSEEWILNTSLNIMWSDKFLVEIEGKRIGNYAICSKI